MLYLKQGNIYPYVCRDLGEQGEGIGKVFVENERPFVVFVPNALPGEVHEIRLTQLKKKYGIGKSLKLIEASPERVEPDCPHFQECGGCQLQHLAPQAQLQWKENKVRQNLIKLAGIENAEDKVDPIMPSPSFDRYRNKVSYPVKFFQGEPMIGFYKTGSHHLIDIQDCLVAQQGQSQLLQRLKALIKLHNVKLYNERTRWGELRHILVRYNHADQIALMFISAKQNDTLFNALGKTLLDEKLVHSVWMNVQPNPGSLILGDQTKFLQGNQAFVEEIQGMTFSLSPDSFFQVNRAQAKNIYLELLSRLEEKKVVFDLYSGVGTITSFLSQKASKVIAIESRLSSHQDAKKNAKQNKIENIEFVHGQVESATEKYFSQSSPDTVVIDPPRKGLNKKMRDLLIQYAPPQILYVSCNPATLARDIKELSLGGYQVVFTKPYDMFPHTTHVETLAELKKK